MVKVKNTIPKNLISEVTFKTLANGLQNELIVIDTEHRVQFVNSTAMKKLLNPDQSPIGKHCYKVFHGRDKPCSAPLWPCPIKEVLSGGSEKSVIYTEHNFGVDTYLEITAYPLYDGEGRLKSVIELRRDVSAERELESQILRRHHQLLVLNHISRAVSGLRNLDMVLTVALDNVLELIDGSIGGILLLDEQTGNLRYQVHRGLSAKYAEEMLIHIGEGIAGKAAETGETIVVEDISQSSLAARPDLILGEGLKGFVSIPLKADEKVMGVMNLSSRLVGWFSEDDVTLLNSIGDYLGTAIEEAKLYERLRKGRERYQKLLQHALTAQEEERRRIARELHDETSQSITSVTLTLQAVLGIAEMQGIGDEEFLNKLRTAHSCSVQAGTEIVKLMKELRPTLLDELGLSAAIQRYAKDTLQTKGINVTTEFQDLDKRLTPPVEVTLFRIAQGAIGNIQEHAEAMNVFISLECTDTDCILQIKDDGKGFEVNKITRVDPSGRGSGLFTMKERARLVDGRCQIISTPGQGTSVTIWIPVGKEVSGEEDKGTGS